MGYFDLLLLGFSILYHTGFVENCNENDNWMRETLLGDRIRIKWNFDEQNLTMFVSAETTGWMGLGFSPSGSMAGADIVIGWIESGIAHLEDHFGTHNGPPVRDDIQSYQLLGGSENDTHTNICWRRILNNCDKQDFKFTNDTIRMIWALSTEDPKDLSFSASEYHGPNRGVQSVNLLAQSHRKHSLNNYSVLDILTKNITIPNNTETLYWCTPFKIPKLKKEYHITGFEPHFQQGHEDLMHHFLIYECSPAVTDDTFAGTDPKGYDSFHPDTFVIRSLCQAVILLWAVGGDAEILPSEVGFPIGNRDRETYYILEMHYNIQEKHHGLIDSSGIRLYYTSEPRKHTAGMFVIGTDITPFQLIPPGQKEFPNTGICRTECMEKTFPPDGINVYSIFFHAHLAARKLRLHRFRNGVELEPFENNNYDFSYQQPVFLTEEFRILPNDTLLLECFYETTERSNTTVGGFSSYDEMCEAFISYYPRTNLSFCHSSLNKADVFNLTGVEEIYEGTNAIKEPSTYANITIREYFQGYTWTTEKLSALRHMYYHGTQHLVCQKLDGTDENIVDYPENARKFLKTDEC